MAHTVTKGGPVDDVSAFCGLERTLGPTIRRYIGQKMTWGAILRAR